MREKHKLLILHQIGAVILVVGGISDKRRPRMIFTWSGQINEEDL